MIASTRGRTSAVMWLAATAFWVFVGLLYMGQLWWLTHTPGVRVTGISRATWIWQGAFYLWWIPLTVLIWRVTERWDPSTLGWRRLVTRHVLFMAGVAVLQSTVVIATGLLILRENESVTTAIIGQTRSRLYQQVIIYAAIAMSGHARVLYERWRRRELQAAQLEAQLNAARLESLRAQLHPHFLFNSLHTIASLVRDGQNDDAVRLISGMSDLLRRILDTHATTHTIEDELAIARMYLDIQQARFAQRLTADITLDPAAAHARVPVLMIQPLVENALRHGLADKIGAGHVRVGVTRDGRTLTVVVDDDGVGVPKGWRLAESSGTGLANIRARLHVMHGDAASLDAVPRADAGFVATVRMPFIPA